MLALAGSKYIVENSVSIGKRRTFQLGPIRIVICWCILMMVGVGCFAFHDDYLLALRENSQSQSMENVLQSSDIGLRMRNAIRIWMCDANCFAFEQQKMVKVEFRDRL